VVGHKKEKELNESNAVRSVHSVGRLRDFPKLETRRADHADPIFNAGYWH
jgi:hypothetical protein